jgi:hypothetical protein
VAAWDRLVWAVRIRIKNTLDVIRPSVVVISRLKNVATVDITVMDAVMVDVVIMVHASADPTDVIIVIVAIVTAIVRGLVLHDVTIGNGIVIMNGVVSVITIAEIVAETEIAPGNVIEIIVTIVDIGISASCCARPPTVTTRQAFITSTHVWVSSFGGRPSNKKRNSNRTTIYDTCVRLDMHC